MVLLFTFYSNYLNIVDHDAVFHYSNMQQDKKKLYIGKRAKSGIPVKCGKRKGTLNGVLYIKYFATGRKGACIWHNGRFYTPCKFEKLAGLLKSKSWRASIKCADGRPLNNLIHGHQLQPHCSKRCHCKLCCEKCESFLTSYSHIIFLCLIIFFNVDFLLFP